jgi:hypothetical protein
MRRMCRRRRDRNGRSRFHTHGTGGQPGPWHRLAHCADSELLPRYRGQRFLSYEIVEAPSRAVITHGFHQGVRARCSSDQFPALVNAREKSVVMGHDIRPCNYLLGIVPAHAAAWHDEVDHTFAGGMAST